MTKPKAPGRPAKARPCRTKNCRKLAVTGEKVCSPCLAARDARRTKRLLRQKQPKQSRDPKSLTRAAIRARERRAEERKLYSFRPDTRSPEERERAQILAQLDARAARERIAARKADRLIMEGNYFHALLIAEEVARHRRAHKIWLRQVAEEAYVDKLKKLFTRAGVTEKQGRAWLLHQLGLTERDGGKTLNIGHAPFRELVTKAHFKLQRFSEEGARSGLEIADDLIDDVARMRRLTGPYGVISFEQSHGDGTGVQRSVVVTSKGTDADIDRTWVRSHELERGRHVRAKQTEEGPRYRGSR